MITGELRSKVDKIWEIFWTGGITNPLSVIEQFTYLLFIKGLDEKQTDLEKNAELLGIEVDKIFSDEQENLRWHKFKQLSASDMYDMVSKKVFPFIKTMHGDKDSAFTRYMDDAIFMIPTPQMLEKIVTNVDLLPLSDGDTKGDLYEYLLSKVATAGTNGQFRTPRHIIKMMVELMQPTPTDIIVDPAAGSAGFLVEAGEYLKRNNEDLFAIKELKDHYNNDMFFGNDMDRTMLRIGAMNMMLHGVEKPNIEYRDSLSEKNIDDEKYTLVLANPPFKGSLDHESVAADLLKITKTKKTELLFLALFLRTLKKGGRCASIVPDGVLFGSSNAHKSIRKEIVENHHLHGIISMPSGVFKPYAGVSTAIMIFTKTGAGGTDNVWFYDMHADGLSLDDKRQPVESNDIPDIISRYHNLENEKNRKRTEKSFYVTKKEIKDNGYDLSINKYKEVEYDRVEYEKPSVIMNRIDEIDSEIDNLKAELKTLLNLDL
ncbi:SAM-dependent DNA methyltransferase [Clostridia bacterium]|uniref:site-specific DNA-methyltransferase (adenine-specific) n=1 Tax=Fusibacter tunisiensis TaxID=1008308 RepID=A0ABS2MUD3_9FIRM|nr:class I SAM-dependent DNA methyltransferase [Fusibacter tunisiensis]MBM7562970.1 type I restriction enzyme M protein [Fusibacter tunisiensis]MDK2832872.1 type restriction enzyme protein [Methanolobus sp.]QRN85676.1 SAM-dependent DNA methyltransferase [Clostridia bacterium]